MTDRNYDLDLELKVITLQLDQLKIEQERLERKPNRVQTRLRCHNRRQTEDNIQGAGESR